MEQRHVLTNLTESSTGIGEFDSSRDNKTGAGVMKRFMRSFSNSLSSTSTLLNTHLNEVETEPISRGEPNKAATIGGSACSGSMSESVLAQQTATVMCEKCNRYPKFKIGICVIYCLPVGSSCRANSGGGGDAALSNSLLSSSFSNDSSSTSSSNNSSSSQSPQHKPNNPQQQQQQKQQLNQSFDKFGFFPHIGSPDQSYRKESQKQPTYQMPLKKQPQHDTTNTNTITNANNIKSTNDKHDNQRSSDVKASLSSTFVCNEKFYEFFSSHLPLIEYQFKELKEKIVKHLPLYFNPVVVIVANGVNNTLASNSVVNRRNNSFSSTNSTTSSQVSEATSDSNFNTGLKIAHQNFIQHIFFVSVLFLLDHLYTFP